MIQHHIDLQYNIYSTQAELITDSKLTESSKKSKKSNKERVESENKNITHIDPQQSTPLPKNADNASTKENADNSEDNSSINSRDINSKSKKLIVILGDSMLKHLNGWEMTKKVKNDWKIFVKYFSDATTNYMEDYIKPSLRKDLNHIILHVGTNNLILGRTSQDIAISKRSSKVLSSTFVSELSRILA